MTKFSTVAYIVIVTVRFKCGGPGS